MNHLSPRAWNHPHQRQLRTSVPPNRSVFFQPRVGSSNQTVNVRSPPSLSPLGSSTQLVDANSKKPFLTLVLFKLSVLSVEFLLDLREPSYQNACTAGEKLDSSVANSSAPTPEGSPARRGHPKSPTKSPLLTWFTPAGSKPGVSSPTRSAVALEGEWEEFQKPFLLFAAAEVWYSEMVHLRIQNGRAGSLSRLYESMKIEFINIRAVLCLPFLGKGNNSASGHTNWSAEQSAAESLSLTLLSLAHYCSSKQILVEAQFRLWNPQINDGCEGSANRHILYKEMQLIVEGQRANLGELKGNAFLPIKEHWAQELEAWNQVVVAALSLEQCRFLESIVSLRLLQKTIIQRNSQTGQRSDDGATPLWSWMSESWRFFCSLLPIYFDKVRCFAGPLYNVDIGLSSTQDATLDWDSHITQFLRQQAKLGGPPTAVSLILDARATNNLNVERGFVPRADQESSLTSETDARVLWPAVYLRTSSTEQMDRSNSMSTPSSRGNSRKSFSQLATSMTANNTVQSTLPPSSTSNMLQYGGDLSEPATTWPHQEWESLAFALCNEETEEDRMVYHNFATIYKEENGVLHQIPEETASAASTPDLEQKGLFETLNDFFNFDDIGSSKETSTSLNHQIEIGSQSSSLHIVSVSSFLSMAVIVKAEDTDSGFLRRRGKLTDSDLNKFLNQTSSNLRVAKQFCTECLPPEAKSPEKNKLSATCLDAKDDSRWDEDLFSILKKVKGAFGLRPASPMTTFSLLPRQRGPNRRPANQGSSSISVEDNTVSLSISAKALFLGDLATVVA